MPFGNEAIRGKQPVQGTGRNSVHVRQISPGDRAQTHEVEIGVLCNQWVEGPLDEGDSAGESVFPLIKLQSTADAAVPMLIQYGRHVGMEKRLAVAPAGNG